MSLLSDQGIRDALECKELEILVPQEVPGDKSILIQPSSIDLRLNPFIQEMTPALANKGEIINPTQLTDISKKLDEITKDRTIDNSQPFVLDPGTFILARTAEIIGLSNKVGARVEGKSSLARFGVSVHLTAPKIDPGWAGPITLEITNLGPHRVCLEPYMEIAVLMIERLSSPASGGYSGRFSGA